MSANCIRITVDDIPAPMRTGARFVRYRLAHPNRHGKRRKIPYLPKENRRARIDDGATWGTLEECVANVGLHGTDGVGLVLTGDGLICIDLDDVREPESGHITDQAMAMIERFDSFTEVSPSGTGVHIWVRGHLPFDGRNFGNGIEIYQRGRFIAFTGEAVPGRERPLRECQDQIQSLLDSVGAQPVDACDASGFQTGIHTSEARVVPQIPLADRLVQARRYLASVAPAIEGKGGDAQTFEVVVSIVRGFDLDCPEGLELVSEYNDTKCHPRWPETDLTRKVALARRTGRLPWGCLLRPRFQLTDSGNAARMAFMCGRDLRYCRDSDDFMTYLGGRWTTNRADLVLASTRTVIDGIWSEAAQLPTGGLKEAVRRHALKTESRHARKAMIELVKAEPYIAVSLSELDADPWFFNVANGTIDLRTGVLRDFDRGDLITKQSPVVWDPTATCPRFLRFLEEIFDGNKALIDFIQRVCGYSLTGRVTEQALLFFYGSGRNGKTTLVETLLSLMGDYGIQAAPEILSLRKGEVHPTEQADLRGVRLAAAQEVKEGGSWDERAVKALTGGDRIRARRMRQDFVEFAPSHKFVVCANHRPVVRGVDNGIWRRIKLVPFTRTIPASECDPGLPEKLRKELPGILNWAVQGCLQWRSTGLSSPPEVDEATARYRAENDVVGRFLDEECVLDPSSRENNAEVYRLYVEWCRAAGEPPLSARGLGERLDDRGLPLKKSGGVNYRVGVRSRPPIVEGTEAPAA